MKSVRKFENLHIFLWLLKDTCWVMDFQALGVFMIFPTLSVAVMITIKTRKIVTELFHNLAVCCWIFANSIWMIGEFFFDDTSRPYATIFFIVGLLIMSYYYLFLQKGTTKIFNEKSVHKGEDASVLEPIE
jgi:hypothetical protein